MLKRTVSIFFLSLLLFNAFGYYLLLGYQQVQAHRIAIENIPVSSFKIVKMLVSAYAHIEDRDFEYVDGSFFYEGKSYNFVKKRIKNDSLELYCLNNLRQDQLTAQLTDYLNQNVILGKSSNNQPTKQIIKSFLKEYINQTIYTIPLFSTSIKKASLNFCFKDEMPIVYLSSFFSPPDLV